MSILQTFTPSDGLPFSQGLAICDLANAIWPPKSTSPPRRDVQTVEQWQRQQSAHFLIGSDTHPLGSARQVLAHALIFPRTIFTERGPLLVGALATVCVHPDFRGRGWGVEVVRAAFNYLPHLGAEVALFQTGVPEFYENLGATLITNRFVNGENPGNPFWDACEMIYPTAFDWPSGQIDLNGAGY